MDNPNDDLNYEIKRTPLDDISAGYSERGKVKTIVFKSDVDQLRELYEREPESLSSIQRLTLGFSELNKQRSEIK